MQEENPIKDAKSVDFTFEFQMPNQKRYELNSNENSGDPC